METGLDSLKENVNDLFFIDDIIPCLQNKYAYSVNGIYDDRIDFVASDNQTDERSLGFAELETALKDFDTSVAVQEFCLLRCFVAEYLERVQQARRDAEVDAMWRSAIVCQLQ